MQENIVDQFNESKNGFDLIFNNMPQGYCLMQLIFDAAGQTVGYTVDDIHSAYEKQPGSIRNDVVGKLVRELLPFIDPDWLKRFGNVVKTGEPVRLEQQIEALNRWFDVQAYSLHKDNKIIVIFSDISPDKEQEFKSNFEKAGYIEEIGLLESVNTLFRSALDCRTEEEIGSACLKLALDTTCSFTGFIGVLNENGLLDDIAICNLESYGESQKLSDPILYKNLPVKGLFGIVLQGKPLITNDPTTHPDNIGVPPGYPAIRSFLGVPLVEKNKIIGIIAVANRPGGYNENDLKLMEMISEALTQVLMRWRTKQAFLESERCYRKLFCAIHEGFLIVDIELDESGNAADLLFIEENQAAERFIGIDCRGKHLSEINPDYDAYWQEILGRVAQTGQSVRIERYEKHIKKWFSFLLFSIGGEDGRRIGILFRDISDRKEYERNLQQKEKEYLEIIDSSSEGSFIHDLEKGEIYYSTEWKKRLGMEGLTPKEAVGATKLLVHPMDIEGARSAFLQAFQNRETKTKTEVRAKTMSSEYMWILSQAKILYNEMGKPVKYMGTHMDITERKNRELNTAFLDDIGKDFNLFTSPAEILKSTGEKIKKYFNLTRLIYSDVDISCDQSTVIYDVHDPGMPSAMGVGRLSDFLPPMMLREEYRGMVIAVDDITLDPRYAGYENTYQKMRVRSEMVAPYAKKDGLYFVVVMQNGEPHKWRRDEIQLAGELSMRIYTQIDRARSQEALKKSERHALSLVEELKKSDKNKNEFLSALSHELRNPLATIVAGLSLLDLSDDKQQTEPTKKIMKRQIDQLCRLVDDLLELTRILNNKIQLKKEKLELNQIAFAATEDYHALYMEKGVKLETQLYEEPIFLCADPVRLTQIIGNLLHNALKFTDQGGKTMVSVRREKKDAVISVKDDGIGIRCEFIPKLFQPFSQDDQSMDRRKGGLGLGLSIVKGIVELHDGSVNAQSEGIGKGSRFSIRLPLRLEESPEEEFKAEGKPGKSLRIVVIDDNQDFALVLCATLKQMGYSAFWAQDGMGGILLAKENNTDVLFCDIGLPGMNGYEVAKRFRKEELLKNVYLIALTGYAGAQDIEFAYQAGFNKHLAKPVDLQVLKNTLAEVPQRK